MNFQFHEAKRKRSEMKSQFYEAKRIRFASLREFEALI